MCRERGASVTGGSFRFGILKLPVLWYHFDIAAKWLRTSARLSMRFIALVTAAARMCSRFSRRVVQRASETLGLVSPQTARALTKPSGLVVEQVGKDGGGPRIKPEDYVRVDYVGWMGGFEGTEIDSAKALKGPAVKFQLGVGAKTGVGGTPAKPVIVPLLPGFEEALLSAPSPVTVGTKLKLTLPPESAFGKAGGTTGAGIAVPPATTVYYELRVRPCVGCFRHGLRRPIVRHGVNH